MAKMDKVTTPEFRLSFPQLFTAKGFDGGEPKYSLSMIFPKKGVDLEPMKKIARAAAEAKWGKKLPANLRMPFRDGAEKEHLEGYGADVVFCSASTKTRPGLVDRARQPIIDPDDVYPGCYCRATVTAFAYDQKGNKGVAFGLHNVQKLRDGDSLSGRTRAEDDFDSVDDEAFGDAAPKADEDDDFLN